MRKNYTHIAVVLDRSGSMAPLKNDVIGGFNHFLAEQTAEPGEATLTLTQFNTTSEVVYDFVALGRAKTLDADSYEPAGGTALLDAVGKTIDAVGARLAALAESQRPSRVICLIITDGEENSSRIFSKAEVKERVRRQTDRYSWDFVFIGANVDAFHEARGLGVAYAQTYTSAHIGAVLRGTSEKTSSYRKGVSAQKLWVPEPKK